MAKKKGCNSNEIYRIYPSDQEGEAEIYKRESDPLAYPQKDFFCRHASLLRDCFREFGSFWVTPSHIIHTSSRSRYRTEAELDQRILCSFVGKQPMFNRSVW